MDKFVDIVFDGPPSHEAGRFVEVENHKGFSINFGEWVERDDGYWVLRIDLTHIKAEALREAADNWELQPGPLNARSAIRRELNRMANNIEREAKEIEDETRI